MVLYEPEIPPNTGNAIRLCANTGAALHLIKPLGFRLDDKSLKRSGLDYHDLARVHVHANLDACVAALDGARMVAVETGGGRCYADYEFRTGDALIFGPETRGLPGAVRAVAGRSGVEMPICLEVFRVMHEGRPVRSALQALMGREVRSETE